MATPTIDVLGVYSLPVTPQLLREQCDILYGENLKGEERKQAERACLEQLASTVLIEVLVSNRNGEFRTWDFCQPRKGVPQDNWQVAWAEAFLTADGDSLLVERGGDLPEGDTLRVAFFIHIWDPRGVLNTSYGPRTCPPVQKMPERLARLVPYVPVD